MDKTPEPPQNPYQSPMAYEPRTTAATESPFGSRYEHLRRVAIYQKGVLIAIAVYLSRFVVNIAGIFIDWQPPIWIGPALGVVTLVAVVGGIVAVGLLAARLHGIVTGIALAFCMFIPCVSLIVLLVVNQQATKLLTDAGVHVGLLGARLSDLKPMDAETVE
jgi:hypothetical protein